MTNTTDSNIHTCTICGRTTECFTYDANTSPVAWYCTDDADRLFEEHQEEAEQYFLNKEERALVAKALDAMVFIDNGEHLDADALNTIIERLRK